MRRPPLLAAALSLVPVLSFASGPTVRFTLPPQDQTPAVFGSLPFPDDLYFDQGQPGDGDGTLLDAGLPADGKMGLAAEVVQQNTATMEEALDQLDGFGTTSAIYFFFDGAVDVTSLPPSPVLTPSLSDPVFCADAASAIPVPITLKFGVDTRIPDVLAILPLPGRPLTPRTRYVCVVRRSVTGSGAPVEPSADWLSVRDGVSANSDADAIFDPVLTTLAGAGVPASEIAGMTVFTTESTTGDLLAIRDTVLPGVAPPVADFTSRPELVFNTPTALDALLGPTPHAHIGAVATGFYASPRFQTHDPDGDGPLADLPIPPTFASCAVPCETTDETFTHDGGGQPVVIDTPQIPVTVVIPVGTMPAGGWPVVIQQHGFGGQRDTAVRYGEAEAAAGFATIGIDAAGAGYRFFDCTPSGSCSQDTANNFGGTAVPDGFVDGQLDGYDTDTVTTILGLLQGFHNLPGIRDNLRQTVVDLFTLVRLLHGHSIDAALGVHLDDSHLFYVGHSLGALVGVPFVGLEPDVSAALLDGAGGNFVTRLFLDSPRAAAGEQVAIGVLGLDPNNVADQYSIAWNLAQTVLDPADAANAATLLLAPVDGSPRNVVQVEAMDDAQVPDAASEVLAVAAGLPLFDPFVHNLDPLGLAVTGTPRTVYSNAGAGQATAALVQTGFAVEAGSTADAPATMSLVPAFPHRDELFDTGQLYPSLARGIRLMSPGLLDATLGWFRSIVSVGPPGTFSSSATPDYDPAENLAVPTGASVQQAFHRPIDQGGGLAGFEPTPTVTLSFTSNVVPGRVTVGRSVLGSTVLASDADVPPGPGSTVGTIGILPFWVTLQQEVPGLFSADLTIAYTRTEVAVGGIVPGSNDEAALVVARFEPGVCAVSATTCDRDADCGTDGPCLGAGYTTLPTTVDLEAHTATATGITDTGTFAVLHPLALSSGFIPPTVTGGAGKINDCRSEWEIVNPLNTPFRDRKGRVNVTQSCHDGDPTCDADRKADGVCTFRIGMCFNVNDPIIPTCTVQDDLTAYELTRPKPDNKLPESAQDGQAMVDLFLGLGGVASGRHLNLITFNPAFPNLRCTGFADFKLSIPPLFRFGKQTIRGIAHLGNGSVDAGGDHLKLRCYPPAS